MLKRLSVNLTLCTVLIVTIYLIASAWTGVAHEAFAPLHQLTNQ